MQAFSGYLARVLAALALTLTCSVFAAPARAQTELASPPPVFSSVDGNGVDVITGSFNYGAVEVVVGQPGAGGLAYERTYIGPGWRDNYVGTINSAASVYTVSIGNSSETFTLASGTYTSDQARGSTLTLSSGVYTYTTSNGAVALFATSLANGGAVWDANVARITSLTLPNGERVDFHYRNVTVQSVPALRLQAVTNNLGYQLHFEYALNNPTLSSQLTQWRRITKVTGINMAVDYCDPTADTCASLTQAWPYATYGVSGSGDLYETVTDELSRTTRYTVTSGAGIIAIRLPSSSGADQIYMSRTSGRVSSFTRGSSTWTYAYSDAGSVRTTTVTDPLSHTRVAVSNLTTVQVTSDTDGVGRTVSFQYDGNERLTRVTMPEGNYTSYTYDARGNVTETRMVAKSGSGLSDIVATGSYSSTCSNQVVCNLPNSNTDPRGYTTDYTYDSTHGGVLSVTLPDPDGAGAAVRPQTRYSYSSLYAYYKNSGGSIVAAPSAVYRLTGVSSCAASAWSGSACQAGDADETESIIGYGANGVANNRLPLTISVGAGDGSLTATTTNAYDHVGNLQTVDGPLSGSSDVTRYRYDATRALVGVIGPDPDAGGSLKHRATRVTYNADGQPTVVEQGTVDSQSDPDWASFASLQQVNTSYDFVGRPIQRSRSAGGSTHEIAQLSYDAAGRLECQTLRMNSAIFASLPSSACVLGAAATQGPDRITRYTYNNANQTTKVTTGYGTPNAADEWTAAFTNNGQLATLTDASSNVTTYEYDGFDRLRKLRFPNTSGGGSSTTDYEQYTYNAGSLVTEVRRRDATTLTTTYDNLGRGTLVDASSNGLDISYSYDNFSRALTMAQTGQTITLTYDQLSRPLTQQSPLGTVSYQYDLAGRRTRLTWPDSLYIGYDYDLYDAVTAMRENGATSGAGVLATFAYNNLGQRTGVTRGNGTTATLSYDSALRLSSLAQNLAGAGDDQTLTFGYNSAGQIVSRVGSDNDYAWTPLAPGTTNYSDNGLNQYTSIGGTSQAYDSRGNLTTGSFGYDIRNNLTSGPSSATLAYDPAGRLYETVGSGVASRFLYDGATIIGEYNASGVLQRRYAPGPAIDEPITWYEGSGTSDRRWLAADERGSVIAVTNASGAATNINRYDEFGIPSGTNAGRFQYTGQAWLPELARYHYRARVYESGAGRFQQSDPILTSGGMNLYAYVGNDPVNSIDPSGLLTLTFPCTVIVSEEGGPTSSHPGTCSREWDPAWGDSSTANAWLASWLAKNDPVRMLEALLRPARINEDPRERQAQLQLIQDAETFQCQMNWTGAGAATGAVVGAIAGAAACSPTGPGAGVCAVGAGSEGFVLGGAAGWALGGLMCRNDDVGGVGDGGSTPIPGRWSRFPGCNAQYQSDIRRCESVGTRSCWESAADRLAYCTSTGGEIGWPRLRTGRRGY